jgi:hypothetical protein
MIGDFAIDFGFVVAGIIPLIVLSAYGYGIHSTGTYGFEGTWRICFTLGLIPPLAVFYFRIKVSFTCQDRAYGFRCSTRLRTVRTP